MFFSHPAHPVIEGAVLIRYGREDLFESGKGVRAMPVKGFGMPARVLSHSDDDARERCLVRPLGVRVGRIFSFGF